MPQTKIPKWSNNYAGLGPANACLHAPIAARPNSALIYGSGSKKMILIKGWPRFAHKDFNERKEIQAQEVSERHARFVA